MWYNNVQMKSIRNVAGLSYSFVQLTGVLYLSLYLEALLKKIGVSPDYRV